MRKFAGKDIGSWLLGRWSNAQTRHVLVAITAAATVLIFSVISIVPRLSDNFVALRDPDTLVRLSSILSGYHPPLPVTVVEIDDRSFANWQATGDTPRDKLAEIIARVREKRPRALILDIDLSSKENSTQDPLLKQTISAYPDTAAPLLLVRRASFDAGGGQQTFEKTPYDEFAANNSNIFWVLSLFDFDEDWSIRKLRLAEASCAENGTTALLSVPMAISLLEDGGRSRLRSQASAIETSAIAACRVRTAAVSGAKPKIPEIGERVRIPYAFVWSQGLGSAGTGLLRNNSRAMLISVPARQLTGSTELAPFPFTDRYVVIGSTHGNSRDFYRTPLGVMPGVYVLANAIAGAPDIVNARSWSGIWSFGLAVVVFGLFMIIAILARGALAALLIGLICVISVVALSSLIIPSVAIEVVTLAVAMLGLQLFAFSIGSMISDLRSGKGWGAFFNVREKKG
jgi:CHASE2 domain-containing sensor protein